MRKLIKFRYCGWGLNYCPIFFGAKSDVPMQAKPNEVKLERILSEEELHKDKPTKKTLQTQTSNNGITEAAIAVQIDFEDEVVKDEPTKDPEVAEKEGVAYWTKMIDDDDDVEVPKPDSSQIKTKINRDLPSKAQVDAHQAEQETWADRWYQNKKVQKVVQDSKIYSKVKANIKTKFVKPIEAIEESLRPGTSAKDLKAEAIRRKLNKNPQNTALPVIGSLDEYSKIKADNEPLETKSDSSDDDSSDEGDGLWSAIMGKD